MERYNRNILIENIGIEGQKKLLSSKVLICGCGGLGSGVISSLASVGIGTIGLVDDDVVEISNLNRQFIHKLENIGKFKVDSAKEWINSYNPDIKTEVHQIRLDESNYDFLKAYDVVIDCFDTFESKFLINEACNKSGKILIHGGVTEFFGQVATIIPDKTACLRCLFPDLEFSSVLKGVISPAVNTVASIQAMEAIKVILGIGEPLINKLLCYDGLKQEFKKINLAKNPECPVCRR